ncbi:MAG: hypothetical protein IT380_29780, partial [Myxococcales bacterium]|nr:hypothetical protein [Myxococcales bacterium]
MDAVYRDAIDDAWEFRDASGNALTPQRPPGLLSRVLRRARMLGPQWFSALEVGEVDTQEGIAMSLMLEANGDGAPDLFVVGAREPVQTPPGAENEKMYLKRNDGLGGYGAAAQVLSWTSSTVHWELELFRVADVDLDGRDDLLALGEDQILSFVRWGHWQPHGSSLGILQGRFGAAPPIGEFWGDNPALNLRVGDVTADTLADIVYVRPPILPATQTSIYVREHDGERPGLIKSVSQARRLESFVYASLEGLADYAGAPTCDPGQVCVKSGMLVVKQHVVRAEDPNIVPSPATNATTYSYRDGRIDLLGRGWLGFGSVTAKDEVTGAVESTDYGVTAADRVSCTGSNCSARYFYPFAFKPRHVATCVDLRSQSSVAGRATRTDLTAAVTVTWTESDTPGFPRVRMDGTQVDTTEREGALSAGTPLGCTTPLGQSLSTLPATRSSRQTTNLAEGAPTSTIQQLWAGDFAAGSVPSNPPGGIHREDTTTTQYPPDPTNWLKGLPRTTTVTSTEPGQSPVSRTLDYEFVSGTSLVSRETRMKGVLSTTSDFELRKDYRRDVANNVDRVDLTDTTHGVTRRAEADFDPAERMFPIAERAFPTLGGPALATQRWFEVSRGLLAKSDDENAQAGVRKYDTFGRLREVEDARAPKRMLAYATNGEGFLEVSDTLEFVTDAGGLLMYEWNHTTSQLDAFERPIRVTSDGWRQKKVERTASYDRLGRLTHESLPFFATEIPEYLVRTYDKLGRVTMLRNTGSGDTETVVYEGLVQRYTDARGMLTKLTRDVKGRLVRSANFENGTREVPTTYEYTAFDSLWKVTDPLGRLRVTSYDVLGRRESLVDPDSGATQSHYNAFDDEKWSQDPRGATLTTTFDGVGRKTGATLVPAGGVAAGLASNTESFVWDTAPSGKGKLASTTSMDGVVTSYGYTSLAQPASETWTIPGAGAYTLTTSYDLSGRVAGHGYPGGFATAFEYDVSGHVANVYWPGAQQPRIFHVEDVNAAGQVTSEEFGNQAITGRVYDKAFRLTYQDTMQRAQIGGSASFFQQLKYEYGPGGVVVAKHDTTKQLSEFFQHDFANRLKQWRVQQRYGGTCRGGIIDYAYDDAGNLLGRTMQGSTGFNVVNGYGPQGQMSGGVNALTSSTEGTAPTTFFKYDAAGNQTGVYYHRAASGPTDPGDKRLSWTHFNLPRQVVDNISATGTTTFRYDAGHQRVVETRGSDVKVTLGQAFEERQSGATTTRTHSVYAEGRLVAQFTQSALYGQWNPNFTATYVHQDALGSPDAMTGGSPGRPRLVERGKYDPFGERRNPDDVFAPAPQVHTRNVGFTGHQPDDSFGLTNMKGRLYDQRTGRFVSADPLVSAPAFGQSFNRYSYVHNDPLHFSDPSGFFLTPTTGGGVAGGATMGLIWALGGVTSWATLGWGLVVSAAVSLLVGCFLGAFFPHQLGLTAPPS